MRKNHFFINFFLMVVWLKKIEDFVNIKLKILSCLVCKKRWVNVVRLRFRSIFFNFFFNVFSFIMKRLISLIVFTMKMNVWKIEIYIVAFIKIDSNCIVVCDVDFICEKISNSWIDCFFLSSVAFLISIIAELVRNCINWLKCQKFNQNTT